MIKHSFVYSISNLATKASGLILLPVYTQFFSVEEFGRLALLLATNLIVSQILVLGQSQSIVRFTTLSEFIEKKGRVFFSIVLALTVVLAAFILISEFVLNTLPLNFNSDVPYTFYLHICLYLITFMVINTVILNKFRAEEKSVLYTVINLLKLGITIAITIYLIIELNYNIEAVLYAQLLGEIISFIFSIPSVVKKLEFKFDFAILKESLIFGVPLILSIFALNFLNVGDRYIIKYVAGEFNVGIFELSSKISGIHSMFLIVPFSLSFLPKAYMVYKSDGDISYYTNLMTYFTFALIWVGLLLAFYADPLIKLFSADERFYPSADIVPVLILGNVFLGMSLISSLGMFIAGKSIKIAIINSVVALVLVGLNFFTIPIWGYHGAAISKAAAYILLFVISLIVSNSIIKIPFEFKRLLILFIVGSVCYFISTLIADNFLFLIVSFLMFCLYPVILWKAGFFRPSEKKALLDGFRKLLKIS